MTILNCKLNEWADESFKMEDIDPNAPSDVIKHVNMLHDLWIRVNPHVKSNLSARNNIDLFFNRLRKSAGIVDASAFDPNFFYRMESRALHGLERLAKGLNLDDGIASYLKNLDRRGKGYIVSLFENVELAKKARVLRVQTNKVLKDLPTGSTKNSIMYKLQETANLQYLLDYSQKLNPAAQAVVLRVQQDNIEYLKRAGLSDDNIMSLSKYANDLVQTQYEIANVVKKAGIDLSDVINEDYIGRVFSPEAKQMINQVVKNKGLAHQDYIVDSAKNWLVDSRNTNMLIPSDLQTIDYLFKRAGIFDRLNATTDEGIRGLMELKGIKQYDTINQLLDEGNDAVLSHVFNNIFSPDELDFMLETGLLSKIPLDSGKVHEHLYKHYKLPFDDLNDIFVTDPVRASQAYRDTLETITTEQSRMFGFIRGAQEKFGIPKDVAISDPEYKEFVGLGKAIPDRLKRRLGSDVSDMLNNVYVHPRIAKVNYADMLLASDPIRLGLVGQTLGFIRKLSSGVMLGTTQWLGKQVIGNSAYLESMGIHPHNYLSNVSRKAWHDSRNVINGTINNFSESLSKVKEYGKGYSEFDLWKALERAGLIDTSTMFGNVNKTSKIDLNSVRRTVRQYQWMKENYPDNVGEFIGEKVISGANAVVDNTLFKGLSYGNELTDNMAKLTMLEQVMSKKRFTRIFDNDFLDSLPYHADIEDALDYVRKHSFMFDDLPNDNAAYKAASSVLPFLSWRIKSAQQTVRYVVENPQKFAAFLKLTSNYQDTLKEDYPVEFAGTESPWTNQNSITLPIRIDKEFTGTGQAQWYANPLVTVIPQLGSIEEVNMFLDDLGMFQSGKRPSNRNENPHKEKTPLLRRLFNSETSPILKGLATAFTGIDEYDREYQTLANSSKKRDLFGIEVSNQSYYWITTALPALKSLNKSFSYTGLAAEAPEFDITTGKWTQGKKSWLGGETDYESRAQQESVFGNLAGLAELIGANPHPINVYWNMGYRSRKEIEYMLRDTQKTIRGLHKKISLASDAEEAAKIKQNALDLITYDVMLRTELGIIVRFAEKNNIPYHKAVDRIIQRNRQISDLLPREEVQRLAEENYKMWVDNPYL